MMWGRQKRLQCLFDELRGIAVLERLDEYRTEECGADPTEADRRARLVRQTRQSELLQEILKLAPAEPRHP
ncbi:MAG TPA: hypothetical protein VJX16_22170 [Terriglobales bacterium]|nr:hypothetical protein [Terriglobales bacterium]